MSAGSVLDISLCTNYIALSIAHVLHLFAQVGLQRRCTQHGNSEKCKCILHVVLALFARELAKCALLFLSLLEFIRKESFHRCRFSRTEPKCIQFLLHRHVFVKQQVLQLLLECPLCLHLHFSLSLPFFMVCNHVCNPSVHLLGSKVEQ